MIKKYKISKGNTIIEFLTFQDAQNFINANADWAGVTIVEFDEPIPPPVIEIPERVTRWQLRAQLAIQNLENNVTAAINGLPSSTQAETEFKIKAQYAWDYSNNIERNSPTVAMIQAVLALTDSEVDDIFVNAYAIDI